PFGGSYWPILAASWANSFTCGWIVSHGGGSVFSSSPIIGVSDCGPLVSLTMISRIGEDDPGPPGPGPALTALLFLVLLQAAAASSTAATAPDTNRRRKALVISTTFPEEERLRAFGKTDTRHLPGRPEGLPVG